VWPVGVVGGRKDLLCRKGGKEGGEAILQEKKGKFFSEKRSRASCWCRKKKKEGQATLFPPITREGEGAPVFSSVEEEGGRNIGGSRKGGKGTKSNLFFWKREEGKLFGKTVSAKKGEGFFPSRSQPLL